MKGWRALGADPKKLGDVGLCLRLAFVGMAQAFRGCAGGTNRGSYRLRAESLAESNAYYSASSAAHNVARPGQPNH